MRDKLLDEICMILLNSGIEPEIVKSRLIIILDQYEVSKRCTELAVISEDDVTKYLRMFLINKRVSGRAERTLEYYKKTLISFFNEVQKNPLDITSDDIKLFLATKEVRDNISKVYQKNLMRVISSFYQWMVKEEHIYKNPMNKVDDIKVPKIKKEAFTEAQIEQLRLCIDGDDRLMCMFELLLSTWCRVSELAQIKIKDIAEDKESILVHGKGSKDRICYVNARAKVYLIRYLNERKDSNEYLFPDCMIKATDKDFTIAQACKDNRVHLRDWWKAKDLVGTGHIDKSSIEALIRKLGRRANVEKTHPHRFRRTGATFALRRGMPIEQVSKILGHESIETTQIYLDISENELEMAHRKYVQ